MAKKCCHRVPTEKEVSLEKAGLDSVECTVLEISRFFFQTFAVSQSQSWLMAFQRAETRFPGDDGPHIGLDILAAVQAMRMSRSSVFHFNNPMCPGCSQFLSEHERQFVGVFRALRNRRISEAQTHALLLCEGNETQYLLSRMMAVVSSVCGDARPPGQPSLVRDIVLSEAE